MLPLNFIPANGYGKIGQATLGVGPRGTRIGERQGYLVYQDAWNFIRKT